LDTFSWEKVSGFLQAPTATVRNLEEGTEYEFRVMAENAMGISEPLTTDHAIKAKHPFDPPSGMSKPTVEDTSDDSVSLAWEQPRKGPVTGYIVEKRAKGDKSWSNANAPRDINARLGEPCDIRIPFTGSPPDKVEMTKNGIPVPLDTNRFKVTVTPDEVIIKDTKVEKDDAGPYEISLKNEKGEATAPIIIKVQGPPDAPKGPLEISDVTGDSCKLAWNPPVDNGGCPITNYVVEKLDKKLGEWVPVSRFVRATEYEVTGLDEGSQYKFRVRAENELGVSEPLEAERTITAENPSSEFTVDVISDQGSVEVASRFQGWLVSCCVHATPSNDSLNKAELRDFDISYSSVLMCAVRSRWLDLLESPLAKALAHSLNSNEVFPSPFAVLLHQR
ncbi:hypothetical protein AHF37_10389, partial [Paragonimus kellicotti]